MVFLVGEQKFSDVELLSEDGLIEFSLIEEAEVVVGAEVFGAEVCWAFAIFEDRLGERGVGD